MLSIFGGPHGPATGRTEVAEDDQNDAVPASLPVGTPNSSTHIESDLPKVHNHPENETASDGDVQSNSIVKSPEPSVCTVSRGPRASLFSTSTQHLLQSNNLNYNFRQCMNRHNFKGTGFIDHDTSGDYDPDTEKPKRLSSDRHNRIRRSIPGDYENDEEIPVAKRQNRGSRQYEQGRKNGDRKIIILQATTQKIKDYLICRAFDDSENLVEEPLSSAGLRSRKGACKSYDQIQTGLCDHSVEDPESQLGHPKARGCKQCLYIGADCSLINDPLHYPCEDCQTDGFECIPITPATFKAACENCRDDRLSCSYLKDQGIDLSSCTKCLETGKICIAGPAKSMRMDDVLAELESRKAGGTNAGRKILGCTPCRRRKTSCSLKNKADRKPCNGCRRNGVDCTFESIPKAPRAPKKKVVELKYSPAAGYVVSTLRDQQKKSMQPAQRTKEKNAEKREKKQYAFTYSPSPSFSSSNRSGTSSPNGDNDSIPDGAICKTITTAFCHPIRFNYRPPTNAPKYPGNAFSASSPPLPVSTCHFCHPGIPYALFGLGARRVRVRRWESPGVDGWDEMKGGWSSDGAEATRMCEECTLDRISITACKEHQIRRIKGLNITTFDFDKPLRSVVERWRDTGATDSDGRWLGLERVKKEDEVKWCSVCPAPAFYECCSGEPEATKTGCGLLLCDVCAGLMCPKASWDAEGRVDGRGVPQALTLDKLIRQASHNRTDYPDGLRADIEFVRKDGEMLRRLDAAFAAEMERQEQARNGYPLYDDEEVEFLWEQRPMIDLTEQRDRDRKAIQMIDLTADIGGEGVTGSEKRETQTVDLTEEWEEFKMKEDTPEAGSASCYSQGESGKEWEEFKLEEDTPEAGSASCYSHAQAGEESEEMKLEGDSVDAGSASYYSHPHAHEELKLK